MFSRRSVLDPKPLDLNSIVENLMKMLSRLIGEQIDLRFGGGLNLPCVEADAGMLEQVLMNLVINARDAMPQGGSIGIATSFVRVDAEQAARSSDLHPGEFLCLAVSDTGCGMDPETLKRIFDPFFTTKEMGKGTGLGLSTVHGIVAQHRGWIEVESAIAEGTTFRVFLPAVSGRHEESKAPSAKAEAAQEGKETILVVEDDDSLRSLAARMLRKRGYSVHEASTGRRALEFWHSHGSNVDLILTDMVMPEGITGLELVERLQALKPGVKAIITSGYSSDIVQAGLPNRTGVAFLPKPYESRTLATAVRECLDGQP
jgi:CheY-like chemotaxis protein